MLNKFHSGQMTHDETVADLGGAVGGNCPPPFMMKTGLGAPFSVRRAPLILTQKHSFFMFRSECGKHIN